MDAAASSNKLRRVAIDPLSRVEGHGKVTLLLDAANRVQQARLHIVEFRGFEAFIVGRPYWEVPVMVQRLCGICPVSHHLAASKAIDAALGIAEVPPTAHAVRRLMHHGQILQSHALHFFHLASPDLLLGVDSDATRRNIIGLAAAYPDIARQGVLLRRFGQELIRLTAGKRIHGTGSVPGGRSSRAQRRALRRRRVRWRRRRRDAHDDRAARPGVAIHPRALGAGAAAGCGEPRSDRAAGVAARDRRRVVRARRRFERHRAAPPRRCGGGGAGLAARAAALISRTGRC